MSFGLDTDTDIRQGKVGIGGLGDRNTLNRVTFLFAGSGIQCIFQLHVSVQRVVFRTFFFLGDGVVEGSTDLCFVREEFS